MIEWLVANYQLVVGAVSGIFGAGAVIGSIRGRLNGVEKQIENLDERMDGLHGKIGEVKAAVESLGQKGGRSIWRHQ